MTDTRFRLVVMGDSYVGKSSIIKRFLYGTFNIDYVATVEDLFSQDFEVGGTCLKVDILDTAGDAQFPAMRRLSIASAQAFLLVYSVSDPLSFVTIKHRFEEIKEQRADFQDIPIVVVGNKQDVVREIEPGDVQDWAQNFLPQERTHVLECSAVDNHNIREIFKSFLKLSKLNFSIKIKASSQDDSELENPESVNLNQLSNKPGGLRRNFSAYGRLKSLPKSKSGNVTPATRKDIFEALESGHKRLAKSGSSGPPSNTESPATSPHPIGDVKFLGFNFPSFGSPRVENPVSTDRKESISFAKSPKRSKSLIRRSSKKVKNQMQHVHNPDDCVVS